MKLKSDEMISQVIRIDDSSHEIPGMAVIGQYKPVPVDICIFRLPPFLQAGCQYLQFRLFSFHVIDIGDLAIGLWSR
jgi:hypothetical protein